MRVFLTRAGLLIAVLLSLVWLCRVPGWDSLLAFSTSFCTYIGLDVWQSFFQLSEHDKKLINSFLELLPSDSSAIRFLREHDMAEPFQYATLEPLQLFIHQWDTADYEFDDKKLEKARLLFYRNLSIFLKTTSRETSPASFDPHFQTMGFNDWEDRPEKWKMKDTLNELGTVAFENHQAFIRLARYKTRNAALNKV